MIMTLEKMDEFFDKRADSYDEHMLEELQLTEFYEAVESCFSASIEKKSLLDLGCGTGLELAGLYKKVPNLTVTGIDLSAEMLSRLQSKFGDKELTLLHSSYLDVDFGINRYDYALSTYSLHHFSEAEKIKLYQRIYASLHDGGFFVEGDYTCKTMAQQLAYIAENDRLRAENGITDGLYHYDIPFTADTQTRLLTAAGFQHVTLIREWDSTSIILAEK